MKNARETAFEILMKIHRNNSYSNLALDSALSSARLDNRDYSFVCALVYGVLERSVTIDYLLSKCLNRPLGKLRTQVHIILRMGVYQLLFMDKIPDSAAINESVKLTRKYDAAYASGLVNAVLRSVQKNGLVFPDKDKNIIEYYSVKYSYPHWIVRKWTDDYGEENAVGIMEKTIGRPPMTARVNTLKISREELTQRLASQGVVCEETELPNALNLSKTGDIEKLKSYKQGLFHIQDSASQYCVEALDAHEGEVVFDLCAAPGGKSFSIAQCMNNKGEIYAFDILSNRVGLIEGGAQRLGIDIIKAGLGDAGVYNESLGLADRVLCDVPCSGLGIIRRKPEIRFKSPEELDKLPDIQYGILVNSSKYVKVGGRLVYSTCALNKKENEQVCTRFLRENDGFKTLRVLESVRRFDGEDRFITLMPHINNTDGFFICAFERTE